MRKPRPLRREEREFRDDRLFIVACDDTHAPKQYLEFLKLSRVKVHVLAATPGQDHQNAIRRLREFRQQYELHEQDELWVLLDTDHFAEGTHLRGFLDSLRGAQDLGAKVALSKPCFELWLLLHREGGAQWEHIGRCRDLAEALGPYDKSALRPLDYSAEAMARACVAAEARDQQVPGGDIPEAATTRVYRLMRSIYRSCTAASVPVEIRGWLSQGDN